MAESETNQNSTGEGSPNKRQKIDKNGFQIFNDPIHGSIELHPLLIAIIHTPQFQRLKDLKQLSFCYWIYPGASHNRFEHSLGTAHLCGKLIDTLQELHAGEYEITDKEALCVKIAGLCHDLGHGPFSHFFDGVYIPHVKPESKWTHEEASCKLFETMLEENTVVREKFRYFGLDGEEYKKLIKDLILGKDPEKDEVTRMCSKTDPNKPKWFLYEIVSNKRNGIDCDKFDYFARDCANVGVTSSFDYRRYFQNVRICEFDDQLQICVRDKEVFNLYELFHTRWSLHHRVYRHKTQAPIQDLVLKAFKEVDDELKISEGIDTRRFTVLTDSLFYDIVESDPVKSSEEMKKAKELLQRIQKRDLYKFCAETQPGTEQDCPEKEKVIKHLIRISAGTLTEEQIFVDIVKINFGMGNKNPVDNVVFFNKSNETFKFRKEQVSQMLPQNFHERYVRVYAQSREDSESIERIQKCFERFCEIRNYPKPRVPGVTSSNTVSSSDSTSTG
ncbi:deoxynucleoside triphosphate triphosphohydrolase SAMHD1-like isoform X1 [Dendronephthya gigantea]|uniref:deoxynucleoside triphosphate triphosphohydrolase SAMHD1-like isoform X1 n=1 Tax=Dendronephthya gigantea TaxID=151771 RepID=UPI00106CE6D9|nr:deoxynucleoside triphosphate triphosphohydrolase SAMHD1-like isoform X1 [Dendronephthya gigantea]